VIPVSLRPATEADTDLLHDIYASTRTEELAPVPWSDEQKHTFLRFQSGAQLTYYREHYPNAEFLVIVHEGSDIGRIFVQPGEADFRVMDVGLLPEWRGKGIGTQLMRDMIERAGELELPVVLHVESFNPAMRLYERLGFLDDGEVGIYRRMTRPVGASA
jgi:ribosomal protein S18 acetylase RimI-like enzyme